MNVQVQDLAAEFETFSKKVPVGAISNEREYNRAVEMLDSILDLIGEKEAGAMARLADAIGNQIAAYDQGHHEVPEAAPTDVLRYLMDEHDLNQSELPEVGNQSVVSQVLSGKRDLNLRQVSALCRRFGVPADVFIGG